MDEEQPTTHSRSSGVSVSYDADGTREVSRLLPANEQGERRKWVHRFPDAIGHYYSPRSMNEDLPLFAGELEFTDEENAVYDARVTYRWAPRPRITVHGTRPAASDDVAWFEAASRATGMWVTAPGVTITLTNGAIPAPPDQALDPDQADVSVDRRIDTELGDGRQLDAVTCLLPNGWPTVSGTGICDPHDLAHTWYGRTTAEGDGWRAELDRTRAAGPDTFKTLQERGGYLFTHTVRLTRIDGSSFTSQQALNVLDRIRLGLALALGRRTSGVLPVGYRAGTAVWALWRSQRVDRYHSTASHWLDDTTAASQVSEIVGKTLDFTRDATAREVLAQAVGYYVAGLNDVDVELQANTAVSGLQLLSYYRFVTVGPHTHRQWKALQPAQGPTEWELRQLLRAIGVSTPVPAHFTHLHAVQQRLAARKAHFDGLGTVVKMRNVATHPTKDQPAAYSAQEWAEAGLLSSYWFGLSLLELIGYRGKIAAILQKRPWGPGELRHGPWSPSVVAGTWAAGGPAET
ncbi:hypothetical protein ABTZ93_35710 [Streptomyces sp. NPDC097941]|uniref:hypothetical protein n=1 Tax=Streptomyces sp. NPDC097941 TaxID=3155685 RepID=UPI003318987E